MTFRPAAALVLALSVSGCVEAIAESAPPPMVSDFNGHVVKVVYHPYALGANYRGSPIYDVAAKVCGGDAIYQGMKQTTPYQGEHILLCVGK